MTLSSPLRWGLAVTLAASAVLAFTDQDNTPAQPVVKRPVASAAAPLPARAATSQPESPWPAVPHRNDRWPEPPAAALAAWGPPPAPIAPSAKPQSEAPAMPQAPAFPYTLIGRLEDAGISRALLSGPLRTIDARAGDLIDGQWRVEAVLPNGVELLWVPGGQRQLVSYRTTT